VSVNRAVVALPFAWAIVYGGACGSSTATDTSTSDGSTTTTDAAADATGRVIYEHHVDGDPYAPAPNGPTDEALAAVLARKPFAGSPKAAAWLVPTDGARLDRTSAATLAWRPTTAARPPVYRAPLPWGGERLAHAHNPPFSGTAYLLEVSTPSGESVLRLFTALTSFTPDADTWARLVAAGPLVLALRTARFTDNRIDADGGPFVTPPITVSFTP
jgi:hypothetical protein